MSNPTNAKEVLNSLKDANSKTIDALKRELGRVRAGKASPAMLESIRVSYYGQVSPLNQIGTVSTPDARTLVIAPWDATVLGEIEKAINQSDLGLTPQNDGKIIRINIPMLTEERRKELVKVVNRAAEEGKVGIRQNRQKANEFLKGLEKAKSLSEDEAKREIDQVQKVTDEAVKEVEGIVAKKTQDIMTI